MNNPKLNTEVLHRSGTAARRANLPAATLRVWERRYGVVDPKRSTAGQRMYSEEDIQRLKILKLLVDRGYAIGTLAKLSSEQLAQLPTQSGSGAEPRRLNSHRWAIVGGVLFQRIHRWSMQLGVIDSYKDIAAAMSTEAGKFADIAIVHSPSLRIESAAQILEMRRLHGASDMAVVYAFGVNEALSSLRRAGIKLVREPLSRAQFSQLVEELSELRSNRHHDSLSAGIPRVEAYFSEEDLQKIEQTSPAVECECPHHLVSLVRQAAAFERFTDECLSHNIQDAAFHQYLGDVANQARVIFETALQQLALHEQASGS